MLIYAIALRTSGGQFHWKDFNCR